MCLNEMEYDGRRDHGVVQLGAWLFLKGKHVNTYRTVKTYAGFVLIVLFVLLMMVLLPNILMLST
jgi:hypothetical protein